MSGCCSSGRSSLSYGKNQTLSTECLVHHFATQILFSRLLQDCGNACGDGVICVQSGLINATRRAREARAPSRRVLESTVGIVQP